jgi:tetratricopeptide (TPR) repeat protein
MNAINPDKELLNKAYDCYNLAYKNKINSPSPYYMGEISLLMDRPYEAKNNFNLYLKTYGNSANGYFGLARAQLKLNESDSALYNLEVAIQIEPKNPQPYYYLSTELQRLGRLKEAEQFLNEFKRLTGQPAQ